MPKVLFVNEHREVEVERGRLISDVASDVGIAVCRQHFRGVPFGDWTVWVKAAEGALSPKTSAESSCKGWKRLANHARVLDDCEVFTQQGLPSRAAVPRAISPLPVPRDDPDAERFDHENDAAGTAWNPYGHPAAVGSGTREPPKYVPKKKKTKKKAEPDTPAEPVVTEKEIRTAQKEKQAARMAGPPAPRYDVAEIRAAERRDLDLGMRDEGASALEEAELKAGNMPYLSSAAGRVMMVAAAAFLLSTAVYLITKNTYVFGLGFPAGITLAFVSVGLSLGTYDREAMIGVVLLPPALWGFIYTTGELDFRAMPIGGYVAAGIGVLALVLAAIGKPGGKS